MTENLDRTALFAIRRYPKDGYGETYTLPPNRLDLLSVFLRRLQNGCSGIACHCGPKRFLVQSSSVATGPKNRETLE